MIDMLKNSEVIKKVFLNEKIEMTDEILKLNKTALFEYMIDQELDCSDTSIPCRRSRNLKKKLKYVNNQFYLFDEYCEHYIKNNPFALISDKFIYQNVNMANFDGSLRKIQEGVDAFSDEEYKKIILMLLKILVEIINKDSWKGIYVYGKAGIGKTYLMKAIAKKYAQNNKTVVIATMESLLADLRTAMSKEYNPDLLTVSKCQEADVLFLDDIGLERATKWSRDEVLFPIINYRFEHKKIIYFSSNLSLDDLKKHYAITADSVQDISDGMVGSQRILDRLKGMIATSIEIKGKSKR